MFQNIDISLVTIYLDIVLHKFFITYLILYILYTIQINYIISTLYNLQQHTILFLKINFVEAKN